jgi:hypothetical protein
MSITVNISRQLERPVLNLFRHCSTSVKKGLDNANKDDYIRQPFALKLKAETIHHVLGIVILHREHQFYFSLCISLKICSYSYK